MSPLPPRVLLVDDEPNLLLTLRRMLFGRYELELATSAEDALQLLVNRPPFEVIVSDMRMPGMDGSQFLARARQLNPDAVRLVLSGHSDLEAAVRAINDGQVFRFLIKPTPRDKLVEALDAAVGQHRLVQAERELLEKTLTGAVDALTEVLALTNPAAFGRSRRVRRICAALGAALKVEPRWALEMAAMLSELGAVTLPPDTALRWDAGEALSESEQAMVARIPEVGGRLLGHIPRIEPVTELLQALSGPPSRRPLGARIVAVAQLVEAGLRGGASLDAVLEALATDDRVDPVVLAESRSLKGLALRQDATRHVPVSALKAGMVLIDDVRTRSGALLISRGHEVSEGLIERLRNFGATVGLKEPLTVMVPDEGEAPVR
jgi:CheY-like chemotaxis protein